MVRHLCRLLPLVLVLCAPLGAWAVNPASWQVALTTTGNNVSWTSPTAVTTGLPAYDWSFEITEVRAYLFLGSQDIVDQLSDDARMGSGTSPGLPLVIVDNSLNEPTTGSSAHIRIEVGADGFGRASATNVTLGKLGILPITKVDVKATISILGVPAGDYRRDGDVDQDDYNVWKTNFGSTSNLSADGNGNHVVDAADYTIWRDHRMAGTGSASAAAVPEPAALWLVGMGIGWLSCSRQRDSSRFRPEIA